MINPRAHIVELRSEKYWLDETGRLKGKNPLASDLQDSIRHLAEGLYSRNAHFIFELIQNAEDNTYAVKEPSLSFRLVRTDPTGTKGSDGVLIVQNNEIGFSTDNIDAICAVGKTTKTKTQGYIGEKGIGFKSVFRVTSNPHIFSNGYAFCLPEQDEETGLGYIVPQWIDNVPEGIAPSLTTIILPLNKIDFGYGIIEEMLRDIELETILFLTKLKEIKVETDTGDALTILKDDHDMPQVQIMLEGTMRGESFSKVDEFLLYAKSFDKPLDITHEKRIGIDQREVSIAFPVSEDKESAGKIFAYLPVRSDTGLPFLINADFILTSSREEILDIPWNRRWLMGCVAELAAYALPRLKERGLLTIDLLEVLAGKAQEIPEKSIFYPIVHAVRDVLLNQELLPADGGTFASARNVKLAGNADLRELISNDQLRELHQTDGDLKWLSGEITERRTPNLRNYLMKVLGVAEIDPDGFTRKLTDSFIEDQSDEWMIALYRFVAPLRALWKPGSGYWNPAGPLRSKQFIRLQDDSHVLPFDDKNKPSAYLPGNSTSAFPTVKRSIANDKEAQSFLKELDFKEPDALAEILEFVLPKYQKGGIKVSKDENIADVQNILDVLIAETSDKKNTLMGELRQHYLLDIKTGDGKTYWLKPQFAYLSSFHTNSPELEHYFEGNPKGYILTDRYNRFAKEQLMQLGCLDKVRVTCRTPQSDGTVLIHDSHGYHQRGLNGFDPDAEIDGLDHAISFVTVQKARIIWDRLKIHYKAIFGTIEKSGRQDFSGSEKENRFSKMGQLAYEKAWLPDKDGQFRRPSDIMFSQLSDELEKESLEAKSLESMLKMKGDVVAILAEKAGIQAEDIELMKRHPKEFQRWKAEIAARNEKPVFPIKTSTDPERREKKMIEKYENAPKKKYEVISQSTKTTENTIDAKAWLNETYKNDAGELICQICKKEMPFKKRDGNYYFEAVEILGDINREMEELHIALCPLCAAMYNEFVKLDENAMKDMNHALKNSEKPEVWLKLGELETSIRFVESHFSDIKTILGEGT